jgi:Tol biopolymer transport system component
MRRLLLFLSGLGFSLVAGIAATAQQPAEAAFPVVRENFRSGTLVPSDDIFVINADGRVATRLTRTKADDQGPAWSPDGRRIAFNRVGAGLGYDIFVMNADGSGQSNLTKTAAEFEVGPTWSPDGTRIAFASYSSDDFDIYVMNADGSARTNLTNSPTTFDGNPDWSPDGRKIAFTTSRASDSNFEIFVMNADGSSPANLSTNPVDDGGPAWSPDGRRIAFSRWTEKADEEIYVMNADGSGQSNLTKHPGGNFGPTWSPDGRRIAFVRSPGRISRIYVMNANGSGQRKLTDGDADSGPSWSPQGSKIAFTRRDFCLVPNVVGRQLRVALRMIRRTYCRVGQIRHRRSSIRARGRVLSQSPRPETRLQARSFVHLVVSRGRRVKA